MRALLEQDTVIISIAIHSFSGESPGAVLSSTHEKRVVPFREP
jgi:hypothetical protein